MHNPKSNYVMPEIFAKGLPVHFEECDYRPLKGRFDKIMSVGMFEHVGCKN